MISKQPFGLVLGLVILLNLGLATAGVPSRPTGKRPQSNKGGEETERSSYDARFRHSVFDAKRLARQNGNRWSVPVAPATITASEPVRVSRDGLAADTLAQPGTQAEPHIHANPTNPLNLVAGWQENRFENGGARTLNFAASTDGGATWIEGSLPNLTTVNGGAWDRASDPWIAFGPENRVYYTALAFNTTSPDNAMTVSTSTDGGLTWGNPVEVFRSTADFNDKEATTVDTFPQSPHFGNIYVAWDINVDQTRDQRLVVARSTDGGQSYQPPATVRGTLTNIGIIPRVGPDGTVHAVWVGSTANKPDAALLFFSKSTDGGRSWSKPKKIGKVESVGIRAMRTGDFLPSFAVGPKTGDLYVAWADGRWTGSDQVTLTISRDGGKTWSAPRRASDGPGDAPVFTVSLAVNDREDVAFAYFSLRNDPNRQTSADTYLQVSTDKGNTFGPGIRITPASFDTRFAAKARGLFFLGDYIGLTGAGDRFHALWTATTVSERGKLQPDVFTARTN